MSQPTFESVYAQWASYIYSLSYRLTGNKADAEDIAQESFVKVYRFLKDYKGGSLKGWLYKIVTNTFYLKIEKEKKKPILLENDPFLNSYSDSTQVDIFNQKEDKADLREAIVSLPVDFRTAVVLADVEGLSYLEISKILNVPIGTVRSRIARGRNILRQKLLGGRIHEQL